MPESISECTVLSNLPLLPARCSSWPEAPLSDPCGTHTEQVHRPRRPAPRRGRSASSRPPTDLIKTGVGIEGTAHVGEAVMRWVRRAGQMSVYLRSARSRRARRVGREPLAEQSLNGEGGRRAAGPEIY